VRAGACSNVQLTTTGATRIYRSRSGAGAATQKNTITVGSDALLEYAPDAIIPFAGAQFAQRTEIQLEAGAGLFWWEILSPGREASSEVFEYERVDLKMDLLVAGRLIAAERLRLEPARRGMSTAARMGAYSTWATFYIGLWIWRRKRSALGSEHAAGAWSRGALPGAQWAPGAAGPARNLERGKKETIQPRSNAAAKSELNRAVTAGTRG
jgi:urease accessory protein UreH